MWRWLAIAAAIYAAGHPDFSTHRPAAFDRSLREFHRDVNRMASGAVQAIAGADHVRSMRQFATLSAQLQAMLTDR